MYRTVIAALALAAVTLGAPRAGAQEPQARHNVVLVSFEGLPPDSAEQYGIMSAFRATLSQAMVHTQRQRDETWESSEPMPNGFCLVGAPPGRQDWTLSIVVSQPPMSRGGSHVEMRRVGNVVMWQKVKNRSKGRRLTRGLAVAIATQTPREWIMGEPADVWHVGVAFPQPSDSTARATRPGREVPWMSAGRAIALLALEELHRRADALPDGQRVDLEEWIRMGSQRSIAAQDEH